MTTTGIKIQKARY